MDNPLLVCVLDGLADYYQQAQPLSSIEAILVAVARDGNTSDHLHDEIRPACGGCASIQHFRNVRVVHKGQGLALGFKPYDDLLGVHAQLDNLEGNKSFNRLLLLGHINYAATALAEFLQQFVAADRLARLLEAGRQWMQAKGPQTWRLKLVGLEGGDLVSSEQAFGAEAVR